MEGGNFPRDQIEKLLAEIKKMEKTMTDNNLKPKLSKIMQTLELLAEYFHESVTDPYRRNSF
jgi:hypothetical protein